MVRIYDAAFATTTGTQHQHLGTFWWIDLAGNTGQWTRKQAFDYVVSHSRGDVYVKEGQYQIEVRAYRNNAGTEWIQTEADGTARDNLITLAKRHAAGLPNN